MGANIVDSRYLEVQETPWNTSRYPYLDMQELQSEEKMNEPHFTNHPEVRDILKILWKRGEIANFSSLPQYFIMLLPVLGFSGFNRDQIFTSR